MVDTVEPTTVVMPEVDTVDTKLDTTVNKVVMQVVMMLKVDTPRQVGIQLTSKEELQHPVVRHTNLSKLGLNQLQQPEPWVQTQPLHLRPDHPLSHHPLLPDHPRASH